MENIISMPFNASHSDWDSHLTLKCCYWSPTRRTHQHFPPLQLYCVKYIQYACRARNFQFHNGQTTTEPSVLSSTSVLANATPNSKKQHEKIHVSQKILKSAKYTNQFETLTLTKVHEDQSNLALLHLTFAMHSCAFVSVALLLTILTSSISHVDLQYWFFQLVVLRIHPLLYVNQPTWLSRFKLFLQSAVA